MKEASGELNMTLITIVAIAAIASLFVVFILPIVRNKIGSSVNDVNTNWQQK
jgi:hypothetical protein